MTPVADAEATLAGELTRVRRSLHRRLGLSIGLAVLLLAVTVATLVSVGRSGRWATALRRDTEPTMAAARIVPHFRGGRVTGADYTLEIALPGRLVDIDRVDADRYGTSPTVEVWVDRADPERVATRWDATATAHRSALTVLATGGLVLLLFAAWAVRTTLLMAWAARRHGLVSSYIDARREGGNLTPRTARFLVLACGEAEAYTTGSWGTPPASGWATMSGPARWRLLADWGRRPTLVHRSWRHSTALRWRDTFEQR